MTTMAMAGLSCVYQKYKHRKILLGPIPTEAQRSKMKNM